MPISTPSKILHDIKVQQYSKISIHGPTSNRRKAMCIDFVTYLLEFYYSPQKKQYNYCLTNNTCIFCARCKRHNFSDTVLTQHFSSAVTNFKKATTKFLPVDIIKLCLLVPRKMLQYFSLRLCKKL